ncbi:alpha-E domain-containing protein [Halovulum dunhuangense]|uniref:Alpha-E domain-containing protein n=1 Tax=Halovulum dunhuangense TaxID=1505036 RepID=A0A849KRQ5_9RHOB|nr:alpha-E domain-containing protein [Halovulum dunhuangense]NNU79539.1 alpha-E domain-containing protein [Halovulum dunhuangense]
MLSRTAENLYWTARHMERADTTARLLEMGYRMQLIPSAEGGHASEWGSILAASGGSADFAARYGEPAERNVVSFLVFDPANPSSIRSSLTAARNNARAVRTALTTEVWEALNQAYLQFGELERTPRSELSLPQICDWTKRAAGLVRGAFVNTQLENEGFRFFNLGYAVERADNTARLLDVKYYVLLPTIDMVGGGVDNYQWTTLLRALSAHRAYHWAYGGDYAPRTIAHFLILNRSCPRSLVHCVNATESHLTALAQLHGQRSAATSAAAALLEELAEAQISDIIEEGLHDFLSRFIASNAALSGAIADSYLFGKV